MKYEVIKDKEDLLVLVINGVVVLISRDLAAIFAEMENDYANRKTKPRRVYDSAVIDTELPIKETNNEDGLTLGRMLGL
jgi:hypothetical protein